MINLRACVAVLLLAAMAPAIPEATAQGYPSKPVHVIVPLAPAGVFDVVTRMVAEKLAQRWGQPVVVENKSGAATTIGAAHVAKSPADGYTMLVATPATVITQYAYRKIPYNIDRDFTPVALLFDTPLVLAVNVSKVPVKNLAEFVAYAKAHPGALTHASAGVGSLPHFAQAMLELQSDIKTLHVPYRGGSQSTLALMSGEASYAFTIASEIMPHLASGKVRVLAVAGPQRIPQLPDVLTFKEAGYPDFNVTSWCGIWVPAGTPSEVVGKINADINAVLSLPDVRQNLIGRAVAPGSFKPAEYAGFVNAEKVRWAATVNATGLTME